MEYVLLCNVCEFKCTGGREMFDHATSVHGEPADVVGRELLRVEAERQRVAYHASLNGRASVAEWQPIETAPKGEDDELLLVGPDGMFIGSWYRFGTSPCWFAGDRPINPTHWMCKPPLPTS